MKFVILTLARKGEVAETVAVNMDLVLYMYPTSESSHYTPGTCVVQSQDASGLMVKETIEQILVRISA